MPRKIKGEAPTKVRFLVVHNDVKAFNATVDGRHVEVASNATGMIPFGFRCDLEKGDCVEAVGVLRGNTLVVNAFSMTLVASAVRLSGMYPDNLPQCGGVDGQ